MNWRTMWWKTLQAGLLQFQALRPLPCHEPILVLEQASVIGDGTEMLDRPAMVWSPQQRTQ
eukprot:376833-Prorocentrum_lima.AAC.1